MADIELVIKIDEKLVEWIDEYYDSIRMLNGKKIGIIIEAIKNGVLLPKGHGRLIDADDIDNHIVGSVDTRDCHTIIEADMEVET